jgi:hypothetical protein
MKTAFLLLVACSAINPSIPDSTINLGRTADQVQDWVVLSDNVMGGVTKSNLEYTDTSMVLSGNISLDNYGGFSSVKTKFNRFDLSEYSGVHLRYKSTNQGFAFTLENSRNWTQPYFKGELSISKENTWTETTIYFKDFKEYQIGEPTGNNLNPSILKGIVRLGVITTEKREGPFSLEVDYIEFVK